MDLPDLFPGFSSTTVRTDGAKIFARIGGPEDAPPVVLVHGYPQTGAMWHAIAPALAKTHRVIVPDLRGYGWSSVPEAEADHAQMSKRAMAADIVRVMEELGHVRFAYVGHDRGARAGYRLALDHPGRLEKLILLDIVPTFAMWEGMNAQLAMKVYHWLFLAQPAPFPERMIGGNALAYLEHTLASWTASKSLDAFDAGALAHYRASFTVPERIAATCEDYRAGATIDLEHDRAARAAGARFDVPTLVLYGASGIPADGARGDVEAGPEAAWKPWASRLDVRAIDAGHFVAEEAPEATLAAIRAFLG
jgi:haloacetate dehalogenase